MSHASPICNHLGIVAHGSEESVSIAMSQYCPLYVPRLTSNSYAACGMGGKSLQTTCTVLHLQQKLWYHLLGAACCYLISHHWHNCFLSGWCESCHATGLPVKVFCYRIVDCARAACYSGLSSCMVARVQSNIHASLPVWSSAWSVAASGLCLNL